MSTELITRAHARHGRRHADRPSYRRQWWRSWHGTAAFVSLLVSIQFGGMAAVWQLIYR